MIAHFSGLPTDSLQKFCLLLIGIYKLGENNILRLGLHCYYLAGRIFQRDLSRMLHLFYKNTELEQNLILVFLVIKHKNVLYKDILHNLFGFETFYSCGVSFYEKRYGFVIVRTIFGH